MANAQRRAPPAIRPVLSDEEMALALRARGEGDDAVAAALHDRKKASQRHQDAYDAGQTLSANDRHVMQAAAGHRRQIEIEAHEASLARAAGPGPAETEADRMGALGERAHNGVAWRDMPIPHLLNAAIKHGNDDMAAYAEWRRSNRG